MAQFDAKIFNPEAFGSYVDTIPKVNKNELIKSGALVQSTAIRNLLGSQTGSFYGTIPMFGRIGGTPDNYDGNTDINTSSMDTYSRSIVAMGRAKAWTERDFSIDITSGVDFMSEVAKQVAEFWDDINTEILFAVLKGIFSMTGAKNLEFVDKHTFDISGETENVVAPTTLNSAILKAGGDQKSKFSMVLMHSVVATNLENLNLLSYLKYTDSNGIQRDLGLGTWNGKTVLIDDGMPVETDEDGDKYTTYVLGRGAIEYADLGVATPYEMYRDPKTNGGQDTLYTRERICYAPFGISFTKKSVTSLSPTNAELENGANWELVKNVDDSKVINHKVIPIARIISRG
jgi:hypothetical protein